MSELSEHRLVELQEIIKKDFGKQLSLNETARIATQLIALYQNLGKSIYKKKL